MTVAEKLEELSAIKEATLLTYQLSSAAEAVRDLADEKESLADVRKLAEFIVDECSELTERLELALDEEC